MVKRKPVRSPLAGFIYIIRDGAGHFKIGITNDLGKRLSSLQSGNARRLSVAFSRRVGRHALAIEKISHRQLGHCRRVGEWFMTTEYEAVETVVEAYQAVGRQHGFYSHTEFLDYEDYDEFWGWNRPEIPWDYDFAG